MLINEYLQIRNVAITTGNVRPNDIAKNSNTSKSLQDSPFATALKEQLDKSNNKVEFSKHALSRLEQREINIMDGNVLDRLNKAVEIAHEKGANETLVIVDQNAFVVNVKNNKVITTMAQQEFIGSVFTNIDSTVII